MKILLAEDERTISQLINHVLAADGHEVNAVRSAAEAIQLLSVDEYDLVLLDLHLSDGDGLQVVDTIANGPDVRTRVIVMTGETPFSSEDPRCARVAGVLYKPFALDELEAAVRRFIV
ncbi:MAG: response regulator [Anaerolineaceae bacterium]